MDDRERHARGMTERRKVLGAAHVDRANARITPLTAEFQDLITRYAWSEVWTRPHYDERTRRVLVIGTLLALGSWDEFTWALTSISDEKLYTLPIAIRLFQQAHTTQWGLVFAASTIAVVPTILIFIVFQRQFVRGVMGGAIKG